MLEKIAREVYTKKLSQTLAKEHDSEELIIRLLNNFKEQTKDILCS